MNKELFVSSTPHETKVGLVEDDLLAEVDELWWVFRVVHVPGAGDGYECSYAPLRELAG